MTYPEAPEPGLQQGLHFADKFGDAFLGVAEEHHALFVGVQVVVHAGKTGAHAALEDDDGFGALHFEIEVILSGCRTSRGILRRRSVYQP